MVLALHPASAAFNPIVTLLERALGAVTTTLFPSTPAATTDLTNASGGTNDVPKGGERG